MSFLRDSTVRRPGGKPIIMEPTLTTICVTPGCKRGAHAPFVMCFDCLSTLQLHEITRQSFAKYQPFDSDTGEVLSSENPATSVYLEDSAR